MAKRLFLRAGEVPVLYGLDSSKSEWALWTELVDGKDNGSGDYGKWQARLMTQIMVGICEDHGLKVEQSIDPHSTKFPEIMPPKAWIIKPSIKSNGKPALLVVGQRTAGSMREWKEPSTIPNKSLMRYKAICAAHNISEILIGFLIDGYSSQLFHVHASEEDMNDIRQKAKAFIETVKNGDEPDIDFNADAVSIRKGDVVQKTEISTEAILERIKERETLIAERAPIDTRVKHIDARISQIDTFLILAAGKDQKIQVGNHFVTIVRDKKGAARVTIIDQKPADLF